ncbi:extracellular solute-binding protein [Ruicaihuangia caeni]|uniref:Extracellular solute-binding protein n=1 Tax=Ruicaihuangia caeni TaxID=3042517 RepID=A0AAW6T670_9MICO|nr:extracellular solute-binding protein [Klugiella sp. YN-L-19]MDI2097858.1 extracellular solute-binding protein [Klugiella sp. YN-L-19]
MNASRSPIRILASASAAPIIRRELNRRNFLALAGALGVTGALAACSPGGGETPSTEATGGPLEKELSIYTWGDYDNPDVLSAFTDELGPRITLDSFNSNEELISKLVAAKGTSGYDIVVPTGVFIPQMIENGLLQKLNRDLIPNLEHMDADYLGRAWDPNNDYSICKAWGTTGFVYDKTKITRELKTWNDFIDAAQNEASGSTSVLDDPAELTGLYFWANGIDWNTTDQGDLDAAEDFLVNTLAPHVSAFDSYPGGAAIPQGTHALMQVWNGDARIGILESPDPDRWQWVLGAPATEIWMDNWAIAAGAPNPEAAHAFIDYVLTPENQLLQVDYIGYHTGAKGIESAAEDAGLPMLDLVFFSSEQVATMHEGEVTEAQQRIVEIWNKMKAAAGA